jgi:hypothetical protein
MSFPPAIDQAWHFAILQTVEYAALCKDLESPLNHSTMTDADSVSKKAKRVQTFFEWYEHIFGRRPSTHDVHWRLEEAEEVIVESSPPTKRACAVPAVDPTRIYFKLMNGATYDYVFVASDKIDHLKKILNSKSGIPTDAFRLVFHSQTLELGHTLADYRIPGGSSLLVVQNLRGC